jgi:hypothetical protein
MKIGYSQKLERVRIFCLVGFVVTAILVVALPLVLVPSANRSGMFWFKIVWAVMLTGIVWGGLYLFFAAPLSPDEGRKGVGRISPALAIGGFWYAIISLALMVIISFLPKADWLDRLHMAVQIILGAAAILLALFLRINLVFAERKDGGAKANPTENPPTK